MRSRFESFGIGQNVRIEWMNEALRLTLEKKPAEECRKLMMCRVLDDTTQYVGVDEQIFLKEFSK